MSTVTATVIKRSGRSRAMVPRAVLVLALLVAVPLAGCLGGTVQQTEWAFDATQLTQAHGDGLDGSNVRIAILDTGINAQHPALTHLVDSDRSDGELVAFRDFLAGGEGVDRAWDSQGHGTHVAAIIAARPTEGGLLEPRSALRGGAPGALFYVARVCGEDTCEGEAVIDAVEWATRQQVDVITLSLGGPRARLTVGAISVGMSQQDQDMQDAVNAAIASGIVVVASAGNEGPDNEDVSNPADIRDVIAVGAVGEDLRVADFSNRGDNPSCNRNTLLPGAGGRCAPHQKPELVAPGVDIASAWLGDEYASATGTSQAVPFVTSAVALMLDGGPGLSDRDDVVALKSTLVETARALSGQQQPHDDAYGYGLVQARDAVAAY